MNVSYQRLMAEATRLTQAGDLQGATAAIQAALGAGSASRDAGNEACVIDVEAREVEPATAPVEPGGPRAGQFIAGSHTEAGSTREYKLYVPPSYRGQALPLVVMLHGCKQHPDDFAAGTRMNDVARERDFFVLYPAQASHANASRCWSWFMHDHQRRGRGEPALLAGMTRDVMKRYNIDAHRVYVAGLSAGGAMAAILGAEYPDLFAAIGVHSGLPPGAAMDINSAFAAMKRGAASSASTRTPPAIVFHGDRDATVHPANGEQIVTASAGDAEPETEPARHDNGRRCTRRIYRDASGRAVAEHWILHGAGHAWSGGDARGSYTDAKGPDATREMLRFMFAHTLHDAG